MSLLACRARNVIVKSWDGMIPRRRKRVDPTTMTMPDIGVSIVDTRVLAHLGVKLKPNTCFGLVAGAHTYFLAADTPEEVCGPLLVVRCDHVAMH